MSDDPERRPSCSTRLRAADPAASLPPADPAQVARLLEDAMSHDLDTGPTSPRPAPDPRTAHLAGRRRGRCLVIAGVGVFAWSSAGDDEPQVPAAATDPAPTVVELSARPPVVGKCAVPTRRDAAATRTTAFDGTVTAIADGTVTLDVTAVVRRAAPPTRSPSTRRPRTCRPWCRRPTSRSGQRYLVSANDGVGHRVRLHARRTPTTLGRPLRRGVRR